jgi:hypothetical protein
MHIEMVSSNARNSKWLDNMATMYLCKINPTNAPEHRPGKLFEMPTPKLQFNISLLSLPSDSN